MILFFYMLHKNLFVILVIVALKLQKLFQLFIEWNTQLMHGLQMDREVWRLAQKNGLN